MSVMALRQAWRQFVCRACGLVYDEAVGDADSGLAAGTRFEDIPDDWCCPLCGVTKADFEPYEAAPAPVRRHPVGDSGRRLSDGAARRGRHAAGVVIVGAGRAGWAAAEALRGRDPALPITLVSSDSGDRYDKPLLSVAMARQVGAGEHVVETGADAARRLDVRLLAETHAVRIDTVGATLRTTRGALPYRDLVLAHGAAPREQAQLPARLCWRINGLDAYRRFRAALDVSQAASARHGGEPAARTRVVIAGAGLVGCELANDLALAGVAVTLLDIATRPLAALADDATSARLLEAWSALPLVFVGGVRIAGVDVVGAVQAFAAVDASEARAGDASTHRGRLRVRAEDGRVYEAEHVVAATGLQTPRRLAASAGLAWDDGIAVEPVALRTSVAHIHALGDCISIDGRAHRYIEPIGRQASQLAAGLTDAGAATTAPFDPRRPPIRVKTTSLPLTFR